MPNHVETELTITGDKKELDKFWNNHIKEGKLDNEIDFDFQSIIPMPEELIGTRSPTPKSLKEAQDPICMGDEKKEDLIAKYTAQFKNRKEYQKKFVQITCMIGV
jgi:hypothetical protein